MQDVREHWFLGAGGSQYNEATARKQADQKLKDCPDARYMIHFHPHGAECEPRCEVLSADPPPVVVLSPTEVDLALEMEVMLEDVCLENERLRTALKNIGRIIYEVLK